MENKKLLWLDCETGGLNAKEHSLLTVAFAVTVDGKITDKKEWKIKDKNYRISPTAMEVNKIDITEHDKVAQEKTEVVMEMLEFINRNFGDEKPTVAGHNPDFDMKFINVLFFEAGQKGYSTFSYRRVDTCNLMRALYHGGVLKKDVPKLQDALIYFDIKVDEKDQHTAMGDVIANIELFNKIFAHIKECVANTDFDYYIG